MSRKKRDRRPKAPTNPKVGPEAETSIADRRRRVSELRLEGNNQRQIARILGVHEGTISRDLDEARADWRERKREFHDSLVERILATHELIMARSWEQWRASCEEHSEATVGNSDGKSKTQIKKYKCVGDPRHMVVIQNSLREICRLIGRPCDFEPDGNPSESLLSAMPKAIAVMVHAMLNHPDIEVQAKIGQTIYNLGHERVEFNEAMKQIEELKEANKGKHT